MLKAIDMRWEARVNGTICIVLQVRDGVRKTRSVLDNTPKGALSKKQWPWNDIYTISMIFLMHNKNIFEYYIQILKPSLNKSTVYGTICTNLHILQ